MNFQKGLLILFIFFSIYFVMPSVVFAEECKCTNGSDATVTFRTGTGTGNTAVASAVDGKWGSDTDLSAGGGNNNSKWDGSKCPEIAALKKIYYIPAEKASKISGTMSQEEYNKIVSENQRALIRAYFYNNSNKTADDDAFINVVDCNNTSYGSPGQKLLPAISGGNAGVCISVANITLTCKVYTEEEQQADANAGHFNEVNKNLKELTQGAGDKEKVKSKPPKFSQKKQTCQDIFGDTGDENSVAWLLQKLFNYIRIFGILITIVLSAIDFSKIIISNDYNAMKSVQKKFTFRMIGVVALIVLPVLVNFLLGLFISGTVTDFSCGLK